jgi:hypothetical protein
VFQMLVSSVSFVLFYMLQLLYLDVSKVDRVLHMWCVWEVPGDAGGVRDITGDVQSGVGPLLVARSRARRNRRSLAVWAPSMIPVKLLSYPSTIAVFP